jgi:hypothetical protein
MMRARSWGGHVAAETLVAVRFVKLAAGTPLLCRDFCTRTTPQGVTIKLEWHQTQRSSIIAILAGRTCKCAGPHQSIRSWRSSTSLDMISNQIEFLHKPYPTSVQLILTCVKLCSKPHCTRVCHARAAQRCNRGSVKRFSMQLEILLLLTLTWSAIRSFEDQN